MLIVWQDLHLARRLSDEQGGDPARRKVQKKKQCGDLARRKVQKKKQVKHKSNYKVEAKIEIQSRWRILLRMCTSPRRRTPSLKFKV
jgi:hypothetical protein